MVLPRPDKDHERGGGRPQGLVKPSAQKHLRKIVAEADRDIDTHEIFLRAILYAKENNPGKDKEQIWELFAHHMDEKYSVHGYIKLWIPNSPNEKELKMLRDIIEDKALLRQEFDKIYESIL